MSDLRTYNLNKVAYFRFTKAKYGGLSNFAPGFPLELNGVTIPTTEALYQASKFEDDDVQRAIATADSPRAAKDLARSWESKTRAGWHNSGKIKVMRWCLQMKLAQNWEKFKEVLDSTENLPIVEFSKKDPYWGAKPVGVELVGVNALGRLLMELRDLANSGGFIAAEPPDIPNFEMFGDFVPFVPAR